jgi:hypothetical protein
MLLGASGALAANDLDSYRGFTLGTTAAEVTKQAGIPANDLKTLHERPSLLQELPWRPPYVAGRESGERDSVATIMFSFIDDRLFRMTVDYERSRTEGLTADDMIAALTAKYGPRAPGRPTASAGPRVDNIDTPTVLAFWQQGDTTVTLSRFIYSSRFTLTVTSVPLDALARKSQAAAVVMDAREAPAREAARAKARIVAERDAAEKARTTNKVTFEP